MRGGGETLALSTNQLTNNNNNSKIYGDLRVREILIMEAKEKEEERRIENGNKKRRSPLPLSPSLCLRGAARGTAHVRTCSPSPSPSLLPFSFSFLSPHPCNTLFEALEFYSIS
eukprot:gene2229-1390_t